MSNFNRFLYNPTSCCTDTVYNKPKITVLACDGAVVLNPSMNFYEYIFTSGTSQNFLTTALANFAQPSGYFIRIKNGKGVSNGDITISINGVSSGTLHPNTNTSNAGAALLYWNGSSLLFL